MTVPTIAVKESLDDLKGIGPSTGISGFKLAHVTGKGLYQYQTGDQSSQDFTTDTWVAPSEDTSGKSGAWERIERTGHHDNVISGTAAPVNDQALFFTSASSQYEQKSAATARALLGLASAAPANNTLLMFASASNQYVERDLLDEDDMASDSAAAVPTQQSVKAYADTKARIATGTYTGDGTTSQGITGVGFQPVYVRIWRRETSGGTDARIYETTDTIVDDNAAGMAFEIAESSGTAVIRSATSRIISLDSDGFTVDDAGTDKPPNKNSEVYNYKAIG